MAAVLIAIQAAIAWLVANAPALITLGMDIAPVVGLIRTQLTAATGQIDQAEFDALDAQLRPFEEDLAARAKEAQARLDSAGAGD